MAMMETQTMAEIDFPLDHPGRDWASVPLVHAHIHGRLLPAIQDQLRRKELVFSGEVLRVRRSKRHWFLTVRGAEDADPRLGLQIVLPADQPEPLRGQMVKVRGYLDARVRDRCQIDFVVEGQERCDEGAFAARFRKQLEMLDSLQSSIGHGQILDLERPIKSAVGLVTGHSSDAAADFERGLNQPGEKYPVAIRDFKASLDDPMALAGMIRRAADDPEVEVVAIVRGGGDALGIHTFDDREVLEAIAYSVTRKFVLLGIGHAEDWSAARELASYVADVPQSAGAWLRRRHRQLYWRQSQAQAPKAEPVRKTAPPSKWRDALRWLTRIVILGLGLAAGWFARPVLDGSREPVSTTSVAPVETTTREPPKADNPAAPSSERRHSHAPKGAR
jgi:exonuclease VII large subunit